MAGSLALVRIHPPFYALLERFVRELGIAGIASGFADGNRHTSRTGRLLAKLEAALKPR